MLTSILWISGFRFGSNTYTSGQERDGLVNSTEGGNIDGLTADGTLRTDTGGIFTGPSVNDGIDQNLDRVLVAEQVDDFECVGDNADGQELLAVVAALHHQAVDQALDDVHLRLLELLLGVAAGGVRQVDGVARLDVVRERDILDLDTVLSVNNPVQYRSQKCKRTPASPTCRTA